ncbi:unnamed protein product [Tuber aestivum]|uniref:P-type Na(+) transporter n=1 Tax=Tuber aestivum TaxID=59557 RepID=A0A292Q556_9PEZI|nr:unnamed protein product [Tuber aestivum]
MASKNSGSQKPPFSKPPYQLSADEVAQELGTNLETGLSPSQAKQNLGQYGENKLEGGEGVPMWKVFIKQISNAMVLIIAMALSYGVKDWIEGGVITAVIFLNVTIGFFQEYRAEKTMDSLRSLSSPTAAVLRDGNLDHVASIIVVPGDIVELKTGDVVPADLRLFEAMNLEMDEALLTGESLPVFKEPEPPIEGEVGVGDRTNMAFSSSTVVKGRARGIVTSTGMATEIGVIAETLKGKTKKPSRSMSRKKHGNFQPVKGATLKTWDAIGKLLGLTVGTPLQRKLAKLAYCLLLCAVVLAIIVFAANKFRIPHEVVIYAISLGIAIIPESLIAVLTITMAVGMKTMVKRKVIVRKLDALEALGGVSNICSDKTGTLTQGRMITRKAWIPGVGIYTVDRTEEAANPTSGVIRFGEARAATSEPIDANRTFERQQEARDQGRSALALKFVDETEPRGRKRIDPEDTPNEEDFEDGALLEMVPELEAFLHSSALCNLATVRFDSTKKQWQATGDPTEIALQVFCHRFDYGKKKLVADGWKALQEYPFDSEVKRMSVIFQEPNNGRYFIFAKGAVERIIDLCTNVGFGDKQTPMTEEMKQEITRQMTTLADQGLRVLAIARRTIDRPPEDWNEFPRDEVEENLVLMGLAGLYDPPRLETKDAVRKCTNAGIQVHMLTGDHPSTARVIAREVGIIPADFGILPADVAQSMVKTAAEFDALTNEEVDRLPALPFVIARCAPNTKVRMIDALHRRGRYAAMTGDGVNDSPSLKRADVGIAMGLAGSDVAKSASDIVLTDDNFESIVNAVEEGRRMFDNIQKFILHLLVSNVGEVMLLIIGLAFRDRDNFSVFPLAPLAILWINMLTSSFPAFGLGLEKATSDIMRRPPHDTKVGVFTKQILVDMVVYGTIMGACSLCTFVIIVYGVGDGNLGVNCNSKYSSECDLVFKARAAVFAQLTWLILISAWEFKSIRRSMFRFDPYQTEHRFPFFRDVYRNKFLFYAVAIGAASVFPVVYIPGLNTGVFKHKGITWEWALSFGAIPVFICGVEAWKFIKRKYGLFNNRESDRVKKDASLSLRQGFFTMAKTVTRTSSAGISRSTTMEKRSVARGDEVV